MNWLKEIEKDFISLFCFRTEETINTKQLFECDYAEIMVKLKNDLSNIFFG